MMTGLRLNHSFTYAKGLYSFETKSFAKKSKGDKGGNTKKDKKE